MKSKIFIISIVLILCLSLGAATAETVSAASKDIHVSISGNDTSNTGESSSPYETIGKAVEQSNDADNVTIYLGAGTFRGAGNKNIEINKAHKSQGGSITIVGQGKDQTFIDGDMTNNIFNIFSQSIVTLSNLTIMNCKNTNGGAINSNGTLTIENCVFGNTEATSQGGAIYINQGNVYIKNSVFNNNTAASYAAIRSSGGGLVLENCNFTNSNCSNSLVYISGRAYDYDLNQYVVYDSAVKNCNFVNITSGGYNTLISIDYVSFLNNLISNCTLTTTYGLLSLGGSNYSYGNNTIINSYNKDNKTFISANNWEGNNFILTILGNTTKTVTSPTNIQLTALLTDDMGNKVSGTSIYFIMNGTSWGNNNTNADGIATYTFTRLVDNGVYIASGRFSQNIVLNNTVVKTGMLDVNINRDPVTYYVSGSGSDDTGDGSESNPYKTIAKAIGEGFSVSIYPTIVILDGTYTGVGNTNLTVSDLGVLTIVGRNYNRTIIDGENINWGFRFGSLLEINLENLTFVNIKVNNYYNTAIYSYVTTIKNCIFSNNINGSSSLVYLLSSNSISNSIFVDNFNVNLLTIDSSGSINIENCSFINNTGNNTNLIYAYSGSVRNSNFTGNKIVSDGAVLNVNGFLNSTNNRFINNTISEKIQSNYYYHGGILKGNNINSTNDIFINNTGYGSAVSGAGNFTNSIFKDNYAENYGGAIYLSGSYQSNVLNLTNCEFENNNAGINGKDIYIYSGSIYGLTLTFKSLTTNVLGNYLTAELSNNQNFVFGGGNVTFYANDMFLLNASVVDQIATIYYALDNGIYTISGNYAGGATDLNIINGTLNINAIILSNSTMYVAKNGSDVTGNGSKENPFATINRAFQEGLKYSSNIFIYIANGVYSGLGNVNITVNSGKNLTIIGENKNNTILNGGKANWAIENLINGRCTLTNLTFTEFLGVSSGYLDAKGIVTNWGNMTIDNCNFISNNGSSVANAANKTIGTLSNITIKNSYFYNNAATSSACLANFGIAYVYDSIFDGSAGTGTTGGVTSAIYNGYQNNAAARQPYTYLYMKDSIVKNSIGSNGAVGLAWNTELVNCLFTGNNVADIIIAATATGTPEDTALSLTNVSFINTYGPLIKLSTYFVNSSNFINLTGLHTNNNYNPTFRGTYYNCIFENIPNVIVSGAKIVQSTINSSLRVQENCTIVNSTIISLNITKIGTTTPILFLDYNWWGNSSKPVFNSDNCTVYLDYWIGMAVIPSDTPGLSQTITVALKAIDAYGNWYDYDISIFDISDEYRNFVLEVVGNNGTLDHTAGYVTNDGFKTTFRNDEKGNYTLKLTYGLSDNLETLTKNVELYTLNTTVEVSVPTTKSKNGSTVIITADVKDSRGNKVNSGTVEFFFNGKSIGNVSVVDGKAILNWTINSEDIAHEITAVYSGTDAYQHSSNYTNFEVATIPTNITINLSKNNGKSGDKVTITIQVTDADGNPVDSGLIEIYIGGKFYGYLAVEDGVFTLDWNVVGNPGKYNILAIYEDEYSYMNNQVEKIFEVNKLPSSMTIGNFKGNYGKNTVLKVTLKDAYGKAIVGEIVKFYVNNKFVGQAKTNSQGIASLNYKPTATGSLTVKTSLDSSKTYLNTAKSSKLVVPKYSALSVKNAKAVKRGKVILQTVLANKGPDKTSKFKITYKLPKGFTYVKPKVSSGKISYNKRSRILTWIVNPLKVSKKKSAVLKWTMKAKRGKYTIVPKIAKTSNLAVTSNNALKKFSVK